MDLKWTYFLEGGLANKSTIKEDLRVDLKVDLIPGP